MENWFKTKDRPASGFRPFIRRPRRSVSRGLTLIELAVSMAILGVLAVGISCFLVSASNAMQTQRTESITNAVGLNIMDQLNQDAKDAVAAQVDGVESAANGAPVTGNRLDLFYGIDRNNITRAVSYQLLAGGRFIRTQSNCAGAGGCAIAAQATFTDPDDPITANIRTTCVNPDTNAIQPCFGMQTHVISCPAGSRLANGTCAAPLLKQFTNLDGVVVNGPILSTGSRVFVNGTLRIEQRPAAPGAPAVSPMDVFGRPRFNINNIAFDVSGGKSFN